LWEEEEEAHHQLEQTLKALEELQKVNEELRQALRNQIVKATLGALCSNQKR